VQKKKNHNVVNTYTLTS